MNIIIFICSNLYVSDSVMLIHGVNIVGTF